MGDEGPKAKPRTGGSSSPWMPSLRKRGEKFLHSKYLVSLVIILTIIDCSLVIAELILDLYSVKKTLLFTEGQTFKFIKSIRDKYPDQVRYNDSVASVYERMAHSTIIWNNSRDLYAYNNAGDTLPTSTSPLGMQNLFYPQVFAENNEQQPVWNAYSQTIHVEKGNNSAYYSTRRFRRSHKSNNHLKESNNIEHNERRTRPKTHLLLIKIVRRVKRYLQSGLKYFASSIVHDRNSTSNSVNDDDTSIVKGIYRNNDSNRQIDDLIFLQKQISEILSMQLNGSKDNRNGYSRTAGVFDANVVDNDGDEAQSTIYSVDSSSGGGGDRLSEDISYPEVVSSDVAQDDDWARGSNVGDESEFRRRRSKRESSDNYEENMRRELQHSEEMEIAHKLHYASLCVSSVLVIEVTMKIICAGSHFLKKKIQVFDAIVIVTSVIVDLIFIKGLPEFAVDDSIFVLALLLPWRVIRVVNSLVMAVIDHEQVKLRLLYSRKKKLDKTVESLRNEIDEIKGTMQEIRSFCIKEGIESSRIDGMLGKFAPRRRKDSKFYTLVKLVMSTASINNNDNDSVSSTSIENDLRHYSNKDSVLNLAASSRGTMTSLKQYLSVPFSNDDSQSMSDGDSLAGDLPGLSPSIYITSPVSDDGKGIMSFCDADMDDTDVDMTCLDPVGRNQADRNNAATIAVTTNTTNINTMNGVSFFVGSQTSLDIGHSQDNVAPLENVKPINSFPTPSPSSAISGEPASTSVTDANKNFHSHQFGQFLTVPNCEDGVPLTVSNTVSNNNNATETIVMVENASTTSLPQGSTQNEMKRSASENVNVTLGFSRYEGKYSHGQCGSPAPIRRLPEVRTKRKIYSRSRSESLDNEFAGQVKRDRSGRSRRNSGDAQGQLRGRIQESQRARSHSPSPMFLSVPGNDSMSCTASRSMSDVSTTGNTYANNTGDGVILRRSCLSLNSAGRKQRDKSPNRVSFKVS